MAEKTEEQKAAEKAAADKAAADKAAEEQKAAEPKPSGHIVTGAAVVLRTEDGSERYLYRGATVGGGFSKESIKHAVSVGLIAKAK